MQLVPLTPDLHRVVAAEDRDPMMATWGEKLGPLRCNDTGFAVLAGAQLLGAGGLVPIWPGHAEAWIAVMRNCTRRQLVPALRLAKDRLDQWQKDPLYRRVQTFIAWDALWRASFAAALGFEIEACCRAWGPDGNDFGLYARLAL